MKLKESEDDDEIEDDDDTEDSEEGEVAAETDNVGDASVEINVEDLIHELEAGDRAGGELAARRRLEEIIEKKRSKRDLEDFEDYDV